MEKMSGQNIDYSPFFAKSVKRFSIPTEIFSHPFSDAVTLLLKLRPELDKEKSTLNKLVDYVNSLAEKATFEKLVNNKNSLLINRHFMSRFGTEPNPNDDGDDVNEDGEKVKKSKEGGPWSKLVASDSLDKDEDDKKTPEPAPKEETPQPVLPAGAVTKSSYVPPHLRNSSARSVRGPESMDGPQVGPTPGGTRGTRRPKHAPDISNEVYFPSLSAAMGTDDPAYKTGQANSNRGFEEVKSGASQSSYNSKANEAPKLATNNKFAALRD